MIYLKYLKKHIFLIKYIKLYKLIIIKKGRTNMYPGVNSFGNFW